MKSTLNSSASFIWVVLNIAIGLILKNRYNMSFFAYVLIFFPIVKLGEYLINKYIK